MFLQVAQEMSIITPSSLPMPHCRLLSHLLLENGNGVQRCSGASELAAVGPLLPVRPEGAAHRPPELCHQQQSGMPLPTSCLDDAEECSTAYMDNCSRWQA